MKVLHVLNSLKFSGAEIMYVDAASFFQSKGCNLTVLATANDLGEYAPYFEKAGYEVLHQPMPVLKNIVERVKYYKKIITFLNKEKYDVVHIHSSGARFGFAYSAWRANIKSVYTFHNVFRSRFLSYPLHLFQRWCIKIIFNCRLQTISDSVYSNEKKRYFNKTTKINNWYGNLRYYPALKGEKILVRDKLKIDDSSLVLISVGGCSQVKRHHDIIKALPLILKSIPDCIYLHLGTGCSEKEEQELAKELGVEKNIRFLGNQENIREYLIASDFYLMPSQFEGIPITTIEAMGSGIPAVLYDVPGLRDFNKSGNNSILIPEDYKMLAKAVIDLISKPEEVLLMTANAKLTVDKFYNLEANAAKIYELYL